ncbi:hypothetical protein GBAR_LOCUS31240 [Geodia barretti]|uniref:Uncharacterized protein n=1 Tax=Geodia barretti TaxID=519541 RepID=A0AA35U0M5_GEOBA|nr:hypothetical protein GBAR_LOCUS31240 [Geodia barretti]
MPHVLPAPLWNSGSGGRRFRQKAICRKSGFKKSGRLAGSLTFSRPSPRSKRAPYTSLTAVSQKSAQAATML